MRRHTIFPNYCRYYSRPDCSDDCSNDIIIPMSGSYCCYYNRDDCSDDCSNDIVIPMSGSYCCYYSRHAIVVKTEATENRIPTHVIFFLIYGCSMSGTVYKKKIVSFEATTMQRSAQHSLMQQSRETKMTVNARFCVFSIVAATAETFRAHAGSSRIIGTLRNRVLLVPQEHTVTTVPGKCECRY